MQHWLEQTVLLVLVETEDPRDQQLGAGRPGWWTRGETPPGPAQSREECRLPGERDQPEMEDEAEEDDHHEEESQDAQQLLCDGDYDEACDGELHDGVDDV